MIKIPEENKHFSKKSLAQPLKNTQSIPFPIPKKNNVPKTFILAIGVDGFDKENQLFFAAKDAQDFADKIASNNLRKQTFSIVLKNNYATNTSILSAFKWIEQSAEEQDDIHILFSGHGTVDFTTLRYYFLSYSPKQKLTSDSLLSDVWISSLVGNIKGNVRFFLDSCFSNNFNDYLINYHPKIKSQQLSSYSSSLSWKMSYENIPFKNGFFTKSILNALDKHQYNFKYNKQTEKQLGLRLDWNLFELSKGLQSSGFYYCTQQQQKTK